MTEISILFLFLNSFFSFAEYSPPPGQNLAGRGKVRKKTGRVKRGRRGAERREASAATTMITGDRMQLTWNIRNA